MPDVSPLQFLDAVPSAQGRVLVDMVNCLDVARDHIRVSTQTESDFFRRFVGAVTGESQKRNNRIAQSQQTVLESAVETIKELAKHPNLFCKVSGLVTEADWRNWKADDFKPYLDVVFDAFGADRIMYGSDWPVCLLAATYQQVRDILADYTSNFSSLDRVKIFRLNASRFYKLKG